MVDISVSHAIGLRVFFFLTVLFVIMIWEWLSPRRKLSFSRLKRWPNNLLLIAFNSFLVRLVLPVFAVGAAIWAQKVGWGLLNHVAINFWFKVIICVIVFDFIIYLQHVIFHAVPLLWRVHKMHHTDLDIDTTTGLRFHPVEILLSMLIKIVAVILLGAPALSVLIFEVLLNATSMFNHGNIYIPTWIDRYLRLIIVTPDMHRVHHSIIWQETNSNYGFNLSWWDRLWRTYKPQPQAGHIDMTIGIEQFREPRYLAIGWLLIIPFIKGRR